MKLEEVRERFPHIKSGRIYFNHAAIGPLSDNIKTKLHEYIDERNSGSIENLQMLLRASQSAKRSLAGLLNTKKNRIAWTENVSSGLNILAQGLSWEKGDRIILNDLEFPSNVYPFLNLQKQGVEVDFAESFNGKVDVKDYEKLITPKTKLISISLVQFLSGYRADIKALGELCREKEIIFCVDAIQATGVVQIDVEDWNIDFLAGGSHKWLMSLQGLGYIYVSPELLDRIDQKYVGWLSVNNEWELLDYDLDLKGNASRYQLGTNNVIGVFALAESLKLFESFGIAEIEKRNLENTTYFISRLLEHDFEPLLTDTKRKNLAGITSLRLEDSKEVFDKLGNYKIDAAVREGVIRFSPHFYNTLEEIDEVISAIEEITKK